MAIGQDETRPTALPPQHAGGTVPHLFRQIQAIDESGVKRSRTRERQLPRKSARLESFQRRRHDSDSDAREEKCPQQKQTSPSRKRARTQRNPPQPSDERRKRKRRRGSAEVNASAPASPADLDEDEQHPIAYWAANKQWPRQYLEPGKGTEHILARKRSVSAESRKNSDADSSTPSSTDHGEAKSREQKSAEYRKPQYATVLATKGVFMEESELDISRESKRECKRLLDRGGEVPEQSMFRDDLFRATCQKLQDKNEARVVQDITRLIVPSAETLSTYGATALKCLIESVNEGWNNCIPITKTRPQPDYAVGFRRDAFNQEQLDRMHPIIGDFNDQSYFMATWYMYFPFITCEVKCGAAALDIADRQNAHSAAIAVRAVVELFRTVKREKELHREVLAFSISHDHRSVRIYGYYVEINDSGTKYYRHPIHTFDFTALEGKEKWTAHNFTKNIYNYWMPTHFKRICSAIDQVPADISFSVSQLEPPYPEQSSDLSQDFSSYSIAQSSIGSASARAQGGPQSTIDRDITATPDTSVADRQSKKQRRETARRGVK